MIIAALIVFGIILGSFVNALVWRLHEQEGLAGKITKAAQKRRIELSITKGRSMCPHCGHQLAAKDLVPIVSWIWLKGKCRYCQETISWEYPAVEVLTGILFGLSFVVWPFVLNGMGLFQFACWLIFLVLCVALGVYDLRWFTLPDKLVLPTTVLAVIQTLVLAVWLHSFRAFWQPALAAIIIFGLFWGLYQISRGGWIGGGDVKLAVALGLLAATPAKAFMVIFFASLIGTIVSIPLLFRGKSGLKLHIPFGPYLLAATMIVVLWGSIILDWYQRLFIA